MSSSSNSPNFEYFPTPRSREENQERAFIAASRRKDRSLDARLESAHRASTLHRQRTGKALNITKEIVENEEMYEEIDVRQQEREIRILQAQNEQGEDQFYSELLASLRLRPNNTDGARGRRHSSVTSRPSANPNGVRRPVSDLSGRRLHNSRPIPAAPVPSQMMSAPPIFESYSQEPQSQQAMPPLPSASPYFSFLDFYPSLPNMNIVPQAPLPSYDPPPQAVSPWPTPSVNNWPFLQENTNTAVAPPQEPYLNPADPMDFADELNFFNGVMAFNNEEDPEFDEFSEFATGLGTNVLPESAAVLWQTQ